MSDGIVIIGAGIGGLTTALALQKKGVTCQVYEASSLDEAVGAGIVLQPNAMYCLDQLGIGDRVRQAGWPISTVSLATASKRVMSSTPAVHSYGKHLLSAIVIHRGRLQRILLGALQNPPIANAHFQSLPSTSQANIVIDGQAETIAFKTLVGADGIHSKVRDSIDTKVTRRTSSQPCWRGITDYVLPPEFADQLTELWGHSCRFGFTHINAHQIYWYATADAPVGEDIHTVLNKVFSAFPAIVRDIISTTKEIYQSPLSDVRVKRWHNDNCVLIGDAAHSMTPNVGQGGAQAIEDALCLAEVLTNPQPDLQQLQRLRHKKTRNLTNIAWQLGQLSEMKNLMLRNMIIRLGQPFAGIQARRMYRLRDLAIRNEAKKRA